MLARTVHRATKPVAIALLITLLSSTTACVIPPSLQVQDDAGVNSPPAILSVTSDQNELAEPGPVLFDTGQNPGSLNVSLIDTDIGDTLYVRIFVDYNSPDATPARVSCTAPPTMTATRTATCALSGLCDALNDVGVQRNMTIVVFDRPLLDSGTPLYQAMAPGGLSTGRFYFLKCQLAQP